MTTTIAALVPQIARCLGGVSDYEAQRWAIENAVGGDMIPARSGADAEISDDDAATLLDVASHLDDFGAYRP